MNSNLDKDLQQIVADIESIKQTLKKLEQDQAAWARMCEEEDLEKILKSVQKLESDVSMMMSDCACLADREQNKAIVKDIQNACKGLNDLFEDLKAVRVKLSDSFIHRDDLNQVEIDLARFRKIVGQIEEHLQSGQNRI